MSIEISVTVTILRTDGERHVLTDVTTVRNGDREVEKHLVRSVDTGIDEAGKRIVTQLTSIYGDERTRSAHTLADRRLNKVDGNPTPLLVPLEDEPPQGDS